MTTKEMSPMMALFGEELEILETEEEKIQRFLNEGQDQKKTKTGKPAPKLDIFKTMAAVDRKDRDFYDKLTDQEKKGFTPFLLVRWLSVVDHSMPELNEWWLRATNEKFNKHLLDLKFGDMPHPKLQWLMATAASPGMGKMKHQWIGYKKKGKGSTSAVRKFLGEQFPMCSDDEINLLLVINDRKSIRAYAKELGLDDKQIKKLF